MATFSEVLITFDNDWILGDAIKYQTELLSTPTTTGIWVWVASRSSGFEVTEGTPTANAGETAAINFKAAHDLDYPTGYIVTVQNNNEVLIQSETEGQDFISVRPANGNTGTATIVFNNYIEPATPASVPLMFTRSPYYVNIPFLFETTTSATIELFTWVGDIDTPPATATETLTKIRPSIDYAEFNVDLAKTTRDQLEPKPVINLGSSSQVLDNDINSVKWVKYVANYTDPSESIAPIEDTLIACDGYGYMQQGANPSRPTNRILTDVNFRKTERGSFILIPFVNDSTITSFDIYSQLGTIDDNIAVTTSDNNYEFVKYLCVNVADTTTDDNIVVTVQPSGDTYTYQILDECRYTPTNVVFKNKYGAFENITMFKKRIENIKVDKQQFKNNYISGGTYDISRHQVKDLNIVGKESVKLNSGYITQDENELYKQLLLSDDVYFYEDNSFIPVRPTTSNLEYKTRVNDTVINYTIDFEYAFNTINNI